MVNSTCVSIVAGLRRAGYCEEAATEQARRFQERAYRDLVLDCQLAAVAEAMR